jgi:hypothetical protein
MKVFEQFFTAFSYKDLQLKFKLSKNYFNVTIKSEWSSYFMYWKYMIEYSAIEIIINEFATKNVPRMYCVWLFLYQIKNSMFFRNSNS